MKNKMIVALTGGLGNQMFQYAFGRVLSNKYEVEIEFDSNFYIKHPEWKIQLQKYNINNCSIKEHAFYGKIRLIFQRIPFVRWLIGTYKEHTEFVIDKNIYSHRYRFYSGYWQNYRYYDDIKEQLVQELKYKGDIPDNVRKIIDEMNNNKSIAVHVRRGDYLEGNFNRVFHCLEENYYKKAIEKAYDTLNSSPDHTDSKVYFFSNDIEWCKKTYGNIDNAVFIDKTISDSEHIDLYIMQHAKCLIMANSTFSWWAAWFNSIKGNYVIAPSKWYVDNKKNEDAKKALIMEMWTVI